MSRTAVGRQSFYLDGKDSKAAASLSQPGDEIVGAWPREQLIEMDQRFCERVERAFAAGKEIRQPRRRNEWC